MKKSNSPIENYKRNMARMNNPPLPMKIFKVDFDFFEAYSDEFSSVIYDWEKTAQKSDLNNDTIAIYKGTYDVLEPYTTVSEEFHGPMVVKKTKMENRRVTRTIEFICIPFSSEKECKQNKRRIKKEYNSPFYKFDSKVKHYQFKNIHLVVRIKGATARDLSNIDLPVIKFV